MSILGNLDNVQWWTLGNTDSWNSMFVEKMCNKLEERASERDWERDAVWEVKKIDPDPLAEGLLLDRMLPSPFSLAKRVFQTSSSWIRVSMLSVSLHSCFTAPTFSIKICSFRTQRPKLLSHTNLECLENVTAINNKYLTDLLCPPWENYQSSPHLHKWYRPSPLQPKAGVLWLLALWFLIKETPDMWEFVFRTLNPKKCSVYVNLACTCFVMLINSHPWGKLWFVIIFHNSHLSDPLELLRWVHLQHHRHNIWVVFADWIYQGRC